MIEKIVCCIGCGGTEDDACWWIRMDRETGQGVCSDCAAFVKTWDDGHASTTLPPETIEPTVNPESADPELETTEVLA